MRTLIPKGILDAIAEGPWRAELTYATRAEDHDSPGWQVWLEAGFPGDVWELTMERGDACFAAHARTTEELPTLARRLEAAARAFEGGPCSGASKT